MPDEARVHDLAAHGEAQHARADRTDEVRPRTVDHPDRRPMFDFDDASELAAGGALDLDADALFHAAGGATNRFGLDAPDTSFHVPVDHAAGQAQHACDAAAVEVEAGAYGEHGQFLPSA